VPRMFERIPGGTEGVMQATLAALHRSGARAVRLSPWHDLDRPNDREPVRLHLSRRPQGEPALRSTRAFVQALVRDGRLPIEA